MEKTIHNFIRGAYLRIVPLHKCRFAYQSGKSTTTELTSIIEGTRDAKQMALVAFIDLQKAFDNKSYAAIERSLENKNNPNHGQ